MVSNFLNGMTLLRCINCGRGYALMHVLGPVLGMMLLFITLLLRKRVEPWWNQQRARC